MKKQNKKLRNNLSWPKVSIVIPATQINQYLLESIPYLDSLDYPDYEVIILPDQINLLKKNNFLKKWGKRIQLIPTSKKGPAEKRDIGIKAAKGKIIAFLDDDAFPRSDWLKKAIRHFRSKETAAIGGPALTPKGSSLWQKVSGAVFESFLLGGVRKRYQPTGQIQEVNDWPSVNLLVRKEILKKLGGFKTNFWPGEDTKLCLEITKNLGLKIFYDPKVIVWHHRRKNLIEHLRQIGNYGLHRGYFVKKFPQTSLKLTYFAPSFLFLILIATIGLTIAFQFKLLNPPNFSSPFSLLTWIKLLWLIGLIGLDIYFLLLILAGLIAARNYRQVTVGLLTIPTIFLTHCYYGLRFFQGLLTNRLDSN
jgi:cellulose synthase/poly-beta-1,6-N-acetylglucosamine synthase-like glycosyltransferase